MYGVLAAVAQVSTVTKCPGQDGAQTQAQLNDGTDARLIGYYIPGTLAHWHTGTMGRE